MQDADINAKTHAAKALLQNPEVKKEIQLVYNAKKNPYNMIIWGELYRTFRPVVNAAIRNSGISKLNLGMTEVEAQANSILVNAVMKYDINKAAAKPSTYFSAMLVGELSKTKRAGRMVSGTDANESQKILINRTESLLKNQGLPYDSASIKKYLDGKGTKLSKTQIEKIQRFNTTEFSGSQSVGGDDSSVAGEMTYQESLDSRKIEPPSVIMQKRNRRLHVYNKLPSVQEKEFIKAVFWLQDDALGLGKPAGLMGKPNPKNFKELCALYRMGNERGKKIYQNFLRDEADLV